METLKLYWSKGLKFVKTLWNDLASVWTVYPSIVYLFGVLLLLVALFV